MEVREPQRQALLEEFKLLPLLGASPSALDLYNMAEGKPDRPIESMEAARVRDPLDQRIAVNLGLAYAIAGRMQEAIAENRRGLAIAPHPILGISFLQAAKALGDPAILEEAWKTYVSMPGTDVFADRLYELRDKPAEALAELRKHGSVSSQWAAFFGDYELSLAQLKVENVPDRRWVVGFGIWRPIMAPVRKLPGFKDLVRDMGLVDYWREFGWGLHCKPVGETDFTCS